MQLNKFYFFIKACFFLLNALCFSNAISAQTVHKHLRQGNKNYDDGNFTAAEEDYRKAAEKGDKTVKSPFNLGNAIYQQKRYDEALKYYENALTRTQSVPQKAKINYNIGNTYMAQKDYKKGIDAYKNALRLVPNDPSVQHNLSVALRLKRQQEQQQQQDKDNKSDKDKKDKDPKKNDKQTENQAQTNAKQNEKGKPEENKQQQNSQQNTRPNSPPQSADAQQPAESLKHEQARELLRIMDNEERKVQEKVHKAKGAAVKNGKDW